MQVSSTLRIEAKKLFWSSLDVWYHIDGLWLLTGGYTGHTEYDVDAMAHVEQINISLGNADWLAHDRTPYS